MKRTYVVSILACLLLAGWAFAYDMNIDPPHPTSVDKIKLTISGDWSIDYLTVTGSNVLIDGTNIYCDVNEHRTVRSGPWMPILPIDPWIWEATHYIGPLQPGEYTVFAREILSDSPPGTVVEYDEVGSFTVTDNQFILQYVPVTVPETGISRFKVWLFSPQSSTVTATVAVQSGDPDIKIQSSAELTFEPGDEPTYLHAKTVKLAAADDPDYTSGTATITITAEDYVTAEISATELDNDVPAVIYVDADAAGDHDGTSWADAFTLLQDALGAAKICPNIREIHVAQGTYRSTLNRDGRAQGFDLPENIAVRGGFAGDGEPDPDARDIVNYPTILTGDFNGDDGPGFANRDDNAPWVVECTHEDAFASAPAHWDLPYILGPPLPYPPPTSVPGTVTFRNTLTPPFVPFDPKVIVGRTTATELDGLTITGGGNGLINGSAHISVTNCIFASNRAPDGGAIQSSGKLTLRNCLFIGNQVKHNSSGRGGAVLVGSHSSVEATNCAFVGNGAGEYAGGLYCYSTAALTNCIFWANTDAGPMDESAQIYSHALGINYSCVQGWTGAMRGIGNIGTDPCFIDPGHWDDNGTPDDTVDDFYVCGDYRLLAQSLCIDAGNPDYLPAPGDVDLEANPRILNGRIDMGPYEYVPPIRADIRIMPRMLNLCNRDRLILCRIHLPEDYSIADIDRDTILLQDQIEPRRVFISGRYGLALAIFNSADLQGILEAGRVELLLTGRLNDGTAFEGTDTIWVIKPHRFQR